MEDKVAFYRLRKGEGDDVLEEEREMIDAYADKSGYSILEEFVSRQTTKISDAKQTELIDAIELSKERNIGIITPKLRKFMSSLSILNLLVYHKVSLQALDMDLGDKQASQRRFLRHLLEHTKLRYHNHSDSVKKGLEASDKVKGRPKSSYRKSASIGGSKTAKASLEFSKGVYDIINKFPGYEEMTLQQIAEKLEMEKILTRSGKTKWALSSVRNLIGRWSNDKR